MKKFLSFLLILLAGITVIMAQTPWKMSYQAVVRDANNWLVPNQTIGVKLSVLQDSINGMPVFAEYHTAQTNANALVSLQIGTGTPLMAYTLADVDWGNHNFFLKSEIDPMGGTNYTISGVQPLIAVPYAFHALAADNADSATFATNADNANNAINANTANVANLANVAYTALHSDTTTLAVHAVNADTAQYALNANVANNSNHANYSDTALYSANANHSNYSDTATYAANGTHSVYSDTAQYAHNAGSANYADSARISNHANTATNANYADSTRISNYANAAGTAATANYADSARISNFANSASTANYADSADVSNYANLAGRADTADFNNLLNRPNGSNTGDMLYWDNNTWQVAPAGNSGDVLQMDTNKVPSWNSIAGASYSLPTVVTNNIYSYDYTGSTVNVSGSVTNGGGTPFVVSGFCWSTNSNPTISNSYSMDGLGVNSMSHQITGLSIGTTYHVRAYAMNNAGVGYGADKSFTTWGYPTVTTNSTVNTISSTYAYSGGDVTSDGGTYLTARGVCWRANSTPYITDSHTSNGTSTGTFTSYMTGLSWGTTYYVRAYATNSIGTSYGAAVSFTTLDQPTVTTNSVTGTTTTTAISGGNVTADGGATVTDRGIVWSTWSYPDIYSYTGITHTGSGLGSFVDSMTNLQPGKTYYVRAYATNAISTAYGNQVIFSAKPTSPQVTTNQTVSNITSSSANTGGNVTYDGGTTVTRRGVCWNTTGNPTIADQFTNNGSGTGSFSSYLSGLNYATTYYYRAYAINSVDTVYGAEESFTTLAILPTVTTNAISDTTSYTAVSGGNVTNDGGAAVTDRGVVWHTSSYPDIYYYVGITHNGTGTGTFTDTMKTLTPGQTYYVRAYATNTIGTAYGSQYSFAAKPIPPTVATSATVTSITGTTAVCGGTVSSTGGATTTRGICWNTTGNPTINDNYATNGTGTGTYNVTMTGLSDSTTYYVCAYATNSAGTSYGTTLTFTTMKLPTVTTDSVIYISPTGATSGVHVIADGGNAVTASGVCWSTSQNPTTSNNKSVDGSGMAPFSFPSVIYNLTDTTTYYVRAYATTTAGTAYGQQRTFSTLAYHSCPGAPTVSDTDGNVYNTIQIGTQCWMRENLRTTKFPDGKTITQGVITSTNVAFRYYPYGGSSYVSTRGYLYNWTAVMNGSNSSSNMPSGVQGICPNGWHVPSMGEWYVLTSYVSGQPGWTCSGDNARALAFGQSSYWNGNTNSGACVIASSSAKPGSSNNMSGFNGMGTGYYYQDGSSSSYGYRAYHWSCTESGANAYTLYLQYSNSAASLNSTSKYYGNSVRCIKDGWVNTDGQTCPGTPTIADNDGHTYNTVYIGGQCWMKENLRTTKYPDGTSISSASYYTTSTNTGYYYHVNNNSGNDATYGLLYNWTAAMNKTVTEGTQGICPTGWHIPTANDFYSLQNYVGAAYGCNNVQNNSAKALASNVNWASDGNTCTIGNNLTANNATGFSAQPVGSNNYGGYGSWAMYWTSSINSKYFYMYNSNSRTYVSDANNYYDFAVRCIKD